VHELSICQALVSQVETIAQQHSAARVVSIVIGMGALSGVEAQLLRHAYPVASAGTVAEDAQLEIEQLPIRVKCSECGEESTVKPNKLLCQHCGDWRTTLISGDELMLMRVELEKPGQRKASDLTASAPAAQSENQRIH
jgi:hydrogenase nickel incorporation protein HypA/HybF